MLEGEITMCWNCENAAGTAVLPRRSFLKFAASAAIGLAASRRGVAAPATTPPKPQNVLSPEAALERLMQGNGRYVEGVSKRHDFQHEREALTLGQNPFAGILGCADSRVAPEYAFDAGRGDLFTCRVAGNIANAETIASLEYAVLVLNTPLLMVLGHQSCGAVEAAIQSIKDGTTLPGHLPSLVESIGPAVKATLGEPNHTLDDAIRQNVLLNVERVKKAAPILSKSVDEDKIRVVGAIYNLRTGRVELVA
jgi:carbonic anhydrase